MNRFGAQIVEDPGFLDPGTMLEQTPLHRRTLTESGVEHADDLGHMA